MPLCGESSTSGVVPEMKRIIRSMKVLERRRILACGLNLELSAGIGHSAGIAPVKDTLMRANTPKTAEIDYARVRGLHFDNTGLVGTWQMVHAQPPRLPNVEGVNVPTPLPQRTVHLDE